MPNDLALMNHEAGEWYVSILCRVEIPDPATPLGKNIGVDRGVDRGVAVPLFQSDGVTPHVPVITERQRLRTKRLQQQIARCKRGSANRKKVVRALARRKAKEARRRKDALHKASTSAAKNHCLIGIEDLRIKNMTASAKGTVAEPGRNVAQKAGLNRSILEQGWGMYAGMLAYKTIWYGSRLVKVPAMCSSQECSECGYTHSDNRATRDMFFCQRCHHEEHADWNASKVIRGRAMSFVKTGLFTKTPEDTCSEAACGALSAKEGVEPGNECREARSHARQGAE